MKTIVSLFLVLCSVGFVNRATAASTQEVPVPAPTPDADEEESAEETDCDDAQDDQD